MTVARSSARSPARLALAALFAVITQACDEIPSPREPDPDAGSGGEPQDAGTGVQGDALVSACPPNAAGSPCGGGSTTPACVQSSDGGQQSGCLCLQMVWVCGSGMLPPGGGGGSADGGPALPPTGTCPASAANQPCPSMGAFCTGGGNGLGCACFADNMGVLRWRCAGA
jgi:hypothetical protein